MYFVQSFPQIYMGGKDFTYAVIKSAGVTCIRDCSASVCLNREANTGSLQFTAGDADVAMNSFWLKVYSVADLFCYLCSEY